MILGRAGTVLAGALLASFTESSASAAEERGHPDLFVGVAVQSTMPLLHPVARVGSSAGFSLNPGYWAGATRFGVLVDVGLGNDCTGCVPFGPAVYAGLGGNASWTVAQGAVFAFVIEGRYRYLSGRRDDGAFVGPVHAPGLRISVWNELRQGRLRERAGYRGAWSLDLYADEWISGSRASPAIGLGLGFTGGVPLASGTGSSAP